jgi:hypothetical protein
MTHYHQVKPGLQYTDCVERVTVVRSQLCAVMLSRMAIKPYMYEKTGITGQRAIRDTIGPWGTYFRVSK